MPRSRFNVFPRYHPPSLSTAFSVTRAESGIALVSKLWTLEVLVETCRRKGVTYMETSAFRSVRGVTFTCGHTRIVCVQQSLPEAEKIFALAHELGHIALGHVQ